jgi:putative endopeptidase
MATTPTRPTRTGLDLQWVDPGTRPQDDLFGHVNGQWLRTHEIPEDRALDGAFRALRDRAEEDVRAIIEQAEGEPGSDAQKTGDLFRSFMDVERIEAAGTAPLRPLLDEVANAGDRAALAAVLGRRQREGRASLFGAYVSTDAKDSTRYLVHLSQSGLGLPDESYYREDTYAEIRAKYVEHLARLAKLVGLPEPAQLAETVMELETALAAASWDRVTNRDAEKTYTLMTLPALRENAPGFDWDAWLEALGAPAGSFDEVIVRQPTFVVAAAKLWAQRPPRQWQAWLAIRTASAFADYLTEAVVEEDFDFYDRTLSGTPRLRERWKRGVSLVEGALGEAVGRLYVQRHFPGSSKERMQTLVANLVEAYRQSISELDWMGPATRERAQAKLAKFTPKIGYPDKWKDYSALEIAADDLFGNLRLRTGEDRQAGGPRRVADDAADGQRLLQPADERDRLPRRDPAAAVLRPRGRRRRELRRDRRGYRPRDRPRLRRPGLEVRRRGQHDRLVGARGPRRVRAARPGPHRAVQPPVPRWTAGPQGQRRPHRRGEYRRPRRPDHRPERVQDRAARRGAAGPGRARRPAAGALRLGAGVAVHDP